MNDDVTQPHYISRHTTAHTIFDSYWGIGYLTATYKFIIVRLSGQCLYYQGIPSDGDVELKYLTPDIARVDTIINNIILISERQSTENTAVRTPSTVLADFNNPFNILSDATFCPFGQPTGIIQVTDTMHSHFNIYINRGRTPIKVMPDTTAHIQVNEIDLSGYISVCTWLGTSLKIQLTDHDYGQTTCLVRKLLLNIPDVSPFQCGMFYSNDVARQTIPGPSLFQDFYNNNYFYYKIKNQYDTIFWQFGTTSMNTYEQAKRDTYVSFRVNFDCKNEFVGLASISVYSVVQKRKRLGGSDIMYYIMDWYTLNSSKWNINILPSYFSSGLYFKLNESFIHLCGLINASYSHKFMNSYSIKFTIYEIEFQHTNKSASRELRTIHSDDGPWMMCWNTRCYFMPESKFLPAPISWNDAEEICGKNHGHLVSLNSDAEQSVVMTWIMNKRRYIVNNLLYGFSTVWKRARLMFLGLHRNKQVNSMGHVQQNKHAWSYMNLGCYMNAFTHECMHACPNTYL